MRILKIKYLCIIIIGGILSTEAKTTIKLDSLNLKEIHNFIDTSSIDEALLEKSVIHITNIYRQEKKQKKLTENKLLYKMAKTHSQQMAQFNFFKHINNKNIELKTIDDRARLFGYSPYSIICENIYLGNIPLNKNIKYIDLAQIMVDELMRSESHRQNILHTGITSIGCGIILKKIKNSNYYSIYLTQNFGRK